MTMKKILTLITLVVFSMFAHGANDTKLVIKQKSGNETILALSTNPIITFVGENMKIENDFINISIPIDDIDDYRVDNPDRIEEQDVKPILTKGHVIFMGIPQRTTAYVYTPDGITVCAKKASDDGTVDFNIDTLAKGTYIIKASNNSIKVTTK